jgi:hypothetical protein
MSNPMAIAAVTATLRRLLAAGITMEGDLNDAIITALPLDKARDSTATINQLNLFLYLITPNAAWRNQDMPGRTRPGETASPMLALNLYYLVSAYGRDNDAEKPFSHLLLGRAMSVLNDHPLLGRDEIAAALATNDLGDQVERLRVTLQPLSIDEVTKVWTGVTQYQLSVAYEVAVVLIDSQRPIRAAPPVLARGPGGRGFGSTADPFAAYPSLSSLLPARPVRLGETVLIMGAGLNADSVTARLSPLRLGQPMETQAVMDSAGGFSVTLPADARLPAGPCMLTLLVSLAGSVRETNELPLLLAPRITSAMPLNAQLGAENPVISINIQPEVLPGQRVALILGDREIAAQEGVGGQLRFELSGVTPGTYLARVRVDGVDSLAMLDPDAAVPVFDPAQTIVVTP